MEGNEGRLLALLEEATTWLRVLAVPQLRGRLETELTSVNDRKIYQASRGQSARDVGKTAGVSHATVVAAWKRWAAAGIVKPTATPGRYQQLIGLAEVGLE